MSFIRKTPTVFVSSTCYDLQQVRADIKDFFETTYGFNAILSEYDSFPIDPAIGTCDNCLNNVDNYADFFVLIIGTRYGYITDKGKSITNLEYLHAKAKGIPLFVFVDKQLYTTWTIWKTNKSGDYSAIVDNPKMFDFISEIYDESQQWVYTYDNVKDITTTMKNQLGLIFSDGLIYKRAISNPLHNVLNTDLSPKAIKTLIEKPFMWEYKFLAHVLKYEFEKLKTSRWNFKYGLFNDHTYSMEPTTLLDDISEKLNEITKITSFLEVLINHTIQDAIGEPGTPSDLEMMIYASRQLASLYCKLIEWGLYFKSLYADEIFDNLLHLLYELPKSSLDKIDNFVEDLYNKFTCIPDTETTINEKIVLNCTLDAGNTEEINAEIIRISPIIKSMVSTY